MKRIFAGTSGWAYPLWKPKFYPADVSAAKFLNHYSGRLNSVEVNYTYRSVVTPDLAARWCDATPPGFLFSAKAPMRITHLKRLRDAGEATAEFVNSLSGIRGKGKLGPVLFQFPPNFTFDLPRLADFLKVLPKSIRAAFEFRHTSWFVDATYAALKKAGCALCYAEDEKLTTPLVRTAHFEYWRLRKPPYKLEGVIKQIRDSTSADDLFVYLKHEDAPDNALLASRLLSDTSKLKRAAKAKR
jgi:uncharacterized protein YecE (DUF72 family)